MRIVCISDTHTLHEQLTLPEGDILIHAGDFTHRGEPANVIRFNSWLERQPYTHKVVIAGNHELTFERNPEVRALITNAIYLQDSGVELMGLHIWGSPVTPTFMDWAFNRDRGLPIKKHWDVIPANTDILITHGPPYGILDQSNGKWGSDHLGCEELMLKVSRLTPKLHVFGHIHGGAGTTHREGITFINAAVVNEAYQMQNPFGSTAEIAPPSPSADEKSTT